METNILNITAEDIKKLDDFYFGPGGEFEHLASIRDIQGYCEDDGAVLTEEELEKAMVEVKILLDDWKEKTKNMSEDEKLEYFASLLSKKQKDLDEKKLIEFWKENI